MCVALPQPSDKEPPRASRLDRLPEPLKILIGALVLFAAVLVGLLRRGR